MEPFPSLLPPTQNGLKPNGLTFEQIIVHSLFVF